MNLRCGKQLPAVVCYIYEDKDALIRMSSASRATRMPVAVYQAVGSLRKSRSKVRRTVAGTSARIDLAARLRTHHRTLRGRVERRDALLDIVRAVNTTVEPPKIAESIVDQASRWVPAPGWAVVADVAGQLSVLTERGLSPDLEPA